MSTRIRNITGGAVTLPSPYRGILPPGIGTILSDSVSTVIANFGGVISVADVFDIGPTTEAGVAANDPAPASSVPNYSNTTRPSAASVPVGSEIFNTDDNAPNYSDGADWRDADGNIT